MCIHSGVAVDPRVAEDWIRAYVEPVGPIETAHERPWATVLAGFEPGKCRGERNALRLQVGIAQPPVVRKEVGRVEVIVLDRLAG